MKTGAYITVNDTIIHYVAKGKGVPLLIIHGWSVDHRLMSGSMEKVFHGRNGRFRRIYVDLPGMGKSSVNPAVRTADDVLDILLRFIDLVIPSENFLLVGESWGGALCRGILEYRKDRVSGLCLLCPVSVSGEKPVPKPDRTVLEADSNFLASLSGREREYFTSLSVVQTKKCWKAFKRDIYFTLLKNDRNYLDRILSGEFTKNIFKNILVYDRPVLLVTGRQDNAAGYKDQMHYFMDFPRATLAVLDKAGHNLQIEQETLFRSLLADWLQRAVESDGSPERKRD